jgi:hypothetical protein
MKCAKSVAQALGHGSAGIGEIAHKKINKTSQNQ